MASSSNRSTELEKVIRYHYKITMFRLYASNLQPQAEFLGKKFAGLLDMSESDAADILRASRRPPSDIKLLHDLELSNRKLCKSDRICGAGNALADVAAALFRAGRAREGAEFCEWGELGQFRSKGYE